MDATYALIQQAQDGSQEAKERLVQENMGLIWSVVRKFTNRGYDADDLFQIGSIGLLKCINKFDLNYQVKFSTYAVPMIMGEIKRFLRDDGMIKVSRPLKEIAIKAKYAGDALAKKSGRQPTLSEIAEELGIEVPELVVAMESGMDVESLHSTVHQGDGTPVYLIDKLDQNEGESDNIVDIIALKQMIGKLESRERQVILMRYFQDKTQSEIAGEIGVSQVQVSRIEKKVLKMMREMFV
ncbi:MAG: RNA polymerase sporulation sigma factor SigF [Defluviitaleaceae bacterium]|nr:RNA polymerase sporulation sigma factor SigF [Defluviitaleaceae bacterium]